MICAHISCSSSDQDQALKFVIWIGMTDDDQDMDDEAHDDDTDDGG